MKSRKSLKRKLFALKSLLEGWIFQLDYITAKRTCRAQIVYFNENIDISKLCVFAGFNRGQKISSETFFYFKELRRIGFEILYVTTSSLQESDIAKLKEYCFGIILRENISLDFGSWDTGLKKMHESGISFKSILLANDSVVGPFFNLRIPDDLKEDEIFGITESWEKSPHLQSYFLYFPTTVVNTDFFKNFWKNFRYLRIKRSVINHYEIGLSQSAIKNNFNIKPLIPYRELLANHLLSSSDLDINDIAQCTIALNPTYHFWETSILGLKMPFLKKDIIRSQAIFHPSNILKLEAIKVLIKNDGISGSDETLNIALDAIVNE